MAVVKRTGWKWCLFIFWLLLVAGLPVYYLRPDFDWHYAGWGTPETLLRNYRCVDDELVAEEGRYTRIFIVQPSAENMLRMGYQAEPAYNTSPDTRLLSHLRDNALPGPYHAWYWPHATGVEFVLCGTGQLLVRDPNRNKGGLLSSRMDGLLSSRTSLSENLEKWPLHVVSCYYWAMLSVATLILTPFVILVCGIVYVLYRSLKGFRTGR